jgi:hypothetical protein
MSVKDPAPARGPVSPASAIRARLRRRTARLGYLVAFLLLAAAALVVFAVCACKSFRIGPAPDSPEITHGPP